MFPANPLLAHMVLAWRPNVTKCGAIVPPMSDGRAAAIRHGLTECPSCYPTPRAPNPTGIRARSSFPYVPRLWARR